MKPPISAHIWPTIVFLSSIVVSHAGHCHAGLRRDETWIAESPNGKLAFVMIPPISLEEEAEQGNPSIEFSRSIRGRFATSGLYSLETAECLWKVDFFDHGPAYVSNGESHVVLIGKFPQAGYPFAHDEILHCIEVGQIVNSVAYSDVSPYWWVKRIFLDESPGCEDYDIRPNSVWIKTNYSETIELDFNTGKVVSFRDPVGNTIGLSLFVLLAGSAYAIGRTFVCRKTSNRGEFRRREERRSAI